MESLQEPSNSCLLREHLELESFGVLEGREEFTILPNLEDTMPFLQMLGSLETPQNFPFKESNFSSLLKLQHQRKRPWEAGNINTYNDLSETYQAHMDQIESCLTHDYYNVVDLNYLSQFKYEIKEFEPKSQSKTKEAVQLSNSCLMRERKKRKRTKVVSKNKEEAESQRMTHIAIERNRRRQMNDHLNSLRSLMPPSYVQRGDQASIIGGAIDFLKELEQLLNSLEAQRRMRKTEAVTTTLRSCIINDVGIVKEVENCDEEAIMVKRKIKEANEEIEVSHVSSIQNHVNLKIRCQRRHGQLLRAIVTMENLRLTVLHLNITSFQTTVVYSFSLKKEEDCKLGSADEVVAAVHQIFTS